MPALSKPRWERFAQAIAMGLGDETWSQGRAYAAAGFNVSNQNSADAAASRMLRRVKPITDRVRELQAQAAKRTVVTVASIVGELEEARELAKRTEQTSTMVAASTAKAKLHGLFVDKHEHGEAGAFEQAGSTLELADAMILQANPAIGLISEEMREMALAELARHADAMAAIASGRVLNAD
jgi:phage terminase small subunit